jgi:hypothetical protein
MTGWYRKRCQQEATATQIDLGPHRQIKKVHALWPQDLLTAVVFEMGSLLILLKLQSSTVLNLTNDIIHPLLYLEHDTHSDSKLAAYCFLHTLVAHASYTSSAIAPLPRYSDSIDPVKFAAATLSYRQGEISKDRKKYL